MPQVMKPQPVQPGLRAQVVPPPVDVPRLYRRADRRGEDQSVVLPGFAQREPLGVLPLAVLSKVADSESGQNHGPPRALRLRFHHLQAAADALQREAHVKLPRFEVDVIPAKAEQLTSAETGRQ